MQNLEDQFDLTYREVDEVASLMSEDGVEIVNFKNNSI